MLALGHFVVDADPTATLKEEMSVRSKIKENQTRFDDSFIQIK